ncbi:MAG: hypothetical protein KDE27_21670, partial [Planctomycetes bacterium]|nr:hypothetical protein [Planctomycetota bacterium]
MKTRTLSILASLSVLAAGCETRGARVEGGGLDASAPLPAGLAERCEQLEQRALTDNEAIATLRSLVDAAPKRLSGSPGTAAAEQWALAKMREIGFDEVRAEPVNLPAWRRGVETASAVSPRALPFRVTALGGSVATAAGGLEAEVVEVRSFEQLQAMDGAAAGKIVFFNRPMPRILRRTGQAYGDAVPQRSNGAIEAAKAGGVAALVRSMTTAVDGNPHTGAMRYEDGVAQVPAAAIATADADALSAMLAQGRIDGKDITWGDTHHPAISETNGEYDGQF